MPVPMIPILIGFGLALLATSSGKKKPSPGGYAPPYQPPGTVPTPMGCVLDAHMPVTQQQQTLAMIAQKDIPPSTLMAAAAIAQVNGYPGAATCLLAEAKTRPGQNQLPPGFDPNNPATWPWGLPGGQAPSMPGMPPIPGMPGQPPAPPAGPPMPPPPPGMPTQPGQPYTPPTPPPPPGQPYPGGVEPPPAPAPGFPLPGWPNVPAGWLPGQPLPGQPGGLPIPGMPGGPALPGGWPSLPGFPGLPTQPPAPPTQPGSGTVTMTIRYGDRPYGIATWYTGQGMRFPELEADNPHLGMFTDGKYPGWIPGNSLTIPASWNPGAKPIPPTGL